MKLPARLLILSACLLGRAAFAAIVVPGANGTDGALTITEDTVIDLSQAPTGTWDQDNTANAGKGVYDPEKWAVVFKYTDVTIASGKKVTFKNHATRAPVVWLVSGNVSIAGTVDLSGESSKAPPILAEPGPGGFRGGSGSSGGIFRGAAFGPGGGYFSFRPGYGHQGLGVGGGFGTKGNTASDWIGQGSTYGNPSLLPLVGGSGGSPGGAGSGGGAGGGAILIAAQNSFHVSGVINAKGGDNPLNDYDGAAPGAGSGGGIRIICDTLLGTGSLNAVGGTGTGWGGNPAGGTGRIRLERANNVNTINVVPAPSTVDSPVGSTALLWPPAGAPTAKVLSVGGVSAPSDPKASMGTHTPDVALAQASSASVVIETTNVEQAATVKVRISPRNGTTSSNGDATEVTAVLDTAFTPPSPGMLRWNATVPTLSGHSVIQARIIRP